MKMMSPQVDFCSGNIYVNLSFQIKKNANSTHLSVWVFVPLKCPQNFEVFQLVWILAPSRS